MGSCRNEISIVPDILPGAINFTLQASDPLRSASLTASPSPTAGHPHTTAPPQPLSRDRRTLGLLRWGLIHSRRLLHHGLLRHALTGPDGRIFADTLTQGLPLVIQIVDSEEAINKFVDAIEGMMGSALVTTEKVKVIQDGTKRIE